MYGKNLTFKTGGVDGCDCKEILHLIAEGKIDTTPLITQRFPLNRIEEAYQVFENRSLASRTSSKQANQGTTGNSLVMKIAIEPA